MAKGSRSNSMKQLRAWKKTHLEAGWQAAADAARFAALNQALASEPVAVPEPQQPAEPVEADVEMDRGRQGGSKKQKASKARRDILPVPVQAESEDMETDGVPTAGKKARAGSKGVQKRQGKKRLIGLKNQFHLSKKSKAKRRR